MANHTNLSRRGLLGAIICAPAIVRASSLMAVKTLPTEWRALIGWWHEFRDLNEASLEDALVQIRTVSDNQTGKIVSRGLVTGHFLEGNYPLREQFLRRAHA